MFDVGPVDEGVNEEISSLTFSPDGTLLASSSSEGWIRIWNIRRNSQNGFKVCEFEHGSCICIAFSRDSKLFITFFSDDTVTVRDLATGTALSTFNTTHDTHEIVYL